MTAKSQPKARSKIVIGALWIFFAGAGVLMFDSCRSNANYEAAQASQIASQNQARGAANRAAFERSLPRRDLVAFVEPHAESNAADIRLEKAWDGALVVEQRAAMNVWAHSWFEIVKANPAGTSKPQLWLHAPDGTLVECLEPK